MVARAGGRVEFVATEPLVDVADETRLAVFAVVDHVDSQLSLPLHDVGDAGAKLHRGCRRIEGRWTVALHKRQQIGRTRQAAGMGGENSVGAVFHGLIESACGIRG